MMEVTRPAPSGVLTRSAVALRLLSSLSGALQASRDALIGQLQMQGEQMQGDSHG